MKDFDRRATFFCVAAIVCLALVPTALPKYRYVGTVLAAVQLVLAVLSQLDHLARRRKTGTKSTA